MSFINLNSVKFCYSGSTTPAIDLSLSIEKGDFVALIGHNGSGKSTAARLLNGLLLPNEGYVEIDGMKTNERGRLFEIRKKVGVVFQNPDNQAVSTIVEDDVAFGPENIGLPREQIIERVEFALDAVGMSEYRKSSISKLSGGQKQRVAIAGVLALKPQAIVLDESTSMLDPQGRDDVLSVVRRLNREEGITVVMITHFMDEAAIANRIVVLDSGRVALDGAGELFCERERLYKLGLGLPFLTELKHRLNEKGIAASGETAAELADSVCSNAVATKACKAEKVGENTPVIVSENLDYTYNAKTPFRREALKNIDIEIKKGDFFGIIGRTGSGKSTLAGHFNALIRLMSGKLAVLDFDLGAKFDYKKLRSAVGMVFQYPEYQLFDETVALDIAFGPKNLGLSAAEIDERVRESMELVGLSYDEYASRSPFELSGGEKRRAALAGVIAMRPEILVLDEPTAGLDPKGKADILSLVSKLRKNCPTTVMISHNMNEIAKYCNRIAVLENGCLAAVGTPNEIFCGDFDRLQLKLPDTYAFARLLAVRGMSVDATDIDTLVESLCAKEAAYA